MSLQTELKTWRQGSSELAESLIDYAESYECKKCVNDDSDFWCRHLLKARREKFRKRIEDNLENLSNAIMLLNNGGKLYINGQKAIPNNGEDVDGK